VVNAMNNFILMWTLLAFSGMDETCYFLITVTHFSKNIMVVMTSDSATRMLCFSMMAALTSLLENVLFQKHANMPGSK
jgi:hypothetical protein